MNEAEIWMRVWSHNPDSNIWKYASVYDLSQDFIREFKDVINWNRFTKKQVLNKYGQKFYDEIMGTEK